MLTETNKTESGKEAFKLHTDFEEILYQHKVNLRSFEPGKYDVVNTDGSLNDNFNDTTEINIAADGTALVLLTVGTYKFVSENMTYDIVIEMDTYELDIVAEKSLIDLDETTHTYTINNEYGMMSLNSLLSTLKPLGGDQHWIIKLSKDMDMKGFTWMPLSTNGMGFITFDGQGHTISNLNCTMDRDGRSGFIGYWGNAYMKDITFENVTAAGSQAGILGANVEVGYPDGHGEPIQNVKIKGTNTVSYQKSPYEYQETWNAVGAIFGFNHHLTSEHMGVTIEEGATVTVNYNGMTTEAPNANEYGFGGTLVYGKGEVVVVGRWSHN